MAMKLKPYTASHFAQANKALLPPGQAWQWPEGGFGDALILAQSQEFARLDAAIQAVLDYAVETHRPAQSNWHIDEYRRVANAALNGITETMPRKAAAIGSHIGDRLWGHDAPTETFTVPLVQVDHLVGPACIGRKIGDRLWGHRARYILRVRYYRSVVNPKVIWDALAAFKQAHVFLWFEDITGTGGNVTYAQN
jgi:hypothetical protein